MPKRMSDDDIMNFVYGKIFGDLDGIESNELFKDDGEIPQVTAPNAAPESKSSGGVKITVEPVMAAAQESGKESDTESGKTDEEEEEDRLKGISKMSPLMAHLHGER